jgi:hypothetical protein
MWNLKDRNMSRFRIGETSSFFGCYVIQKKTWYGWSDWCYYDWEEDAIYDAKRLQRKGHKVDWYL